MNLKKELDAISDLDQTYNDYWTLQTEYQNQSLIDIPWDEFIKIVSMMNIKSRGIKIERRIIEKNNWKKAVQKEQGDAWLPSGEGIEIKTSFITPLKGSAVSLTGLRLWEDQVKYYFLLVIDISDLSSAPKTYAYWVPKEELQKLDDAGRLGIPGMKKSAATGNANVAKSLNNKKYELDEWAEKYSPYVGFKL